LAYIYIYIYIYMHNKTKCLPNGGGKGRGRETTTIFTTTIFTTTIFTTTTTTTSAATIFTPAAKRREGVLRIFEETDEVGLGRFLQCKESLIEEGRKEGCQGNNKKREAKEGHMEEGR
jgi:hypothetical protein